jgi:hypothetical protein
MNSTDKPTNLQNILAQFHEDARNNRDLGDGFERMMQHFLPADPTPLTAGNAKSLIVDGALRAVQLAYHSRKSWDKIATG